MTKAIAVRREGDTFQARIFWRKAAQLLDPTSPVTRVGFESGPKGFDDVWVEYVSGREPGDHEGNPVRREHIQCKWHVAADDYGYADLISPDWINASSVSFLMRARNAQVLYAKDGIGVRFKLLTNWRIGQNDPLRPLIYQRSQTLRLDDLFGTKTDTSAVGKIRKLWREHLGIDDTELRLLARTLSLATDTTSLDDHRDTLDLLFENRGLRRIPASESSFIYDDLAFQWLSQGRLEFDRQSFRAICAREGLLTAHQKPMVAFGVKSFEHAFDRLEDRCTAVLDLISHFDERAIRDHVAWASTLYPSLDTFLKAAAQGSQHLRLVLDTHISLAFAAGAVLNIKSGRRVELEQRTLHRQIWRSDDLPHDPAWPSWQFDLVILDASKSDIAVAVSLTHNITLAVEAFIKQSAPSVGKLLIVKPSCGAGSRSIACGQHAFELAESLALRINQEQTPGKPPLHLFIAAPNAFTFFLGQRQPSFGKVTLYEYDFEGGTDATYQPSLSLPISKTT